MLDVIYDDKRELTKNELANLNAKKNSIPVDYFRKNLFNGSTRTSKELKKLKTIFDNGKESVLVNRSLHQKHRDLLSILFTDSKDITTKKDGSVEIKTSLYSIAKNMGYKNIRGSIELVKGFLFDLRNTELTFKTKNRDIKYKERGGHHLLGEYKYDEDNEDYIINIPSKTNKYKILNYAVEIPKEINRRIISIPNKKSKLKALVLYMLSNKALKNGISFDIICNKLEIEASNRKSEFKKELRENKDLLREFNIEYNEDSKIIKYIQLDDVKFHRAMNNNEIINIIDKESSNKKEDDEISKYGFPKYIYVNKYLKHKSKSILGEEEIVISKIINIEVQDLNNIKEYRFELETSSQNSLFTIWLDINQLKNLEEKYINENEDF